MKTHLNKTSPGVGQDKSKGSTGISMPAVTQQVIQPKPASAQQGPGPDNSSIQENQSPGEAWHVVQHKQERLQRAAKASGGILQPKWIPSDKDNILKWDAAPKGRQWYYNTLTGNEFFTDLGKEGQSKEFPYIEWLKMGMQGIKDRDLQVDREKDSPGINARVETPEENFLKLRNEGMALFQSINPGGGNTKQDEIWQSQYNGTTEIEDDDPSKVNVKTGWKATYSVRMSKHDAKGRYHNQFNLLTGEIIAVDNHRDTNNKEPLNNNEIIYHQFRMAAEKYGTKLKATSLLRKNVINSVLEPILRSSKNAGKITPQHDLFFVLLTTPNVKAALFMINDHGRLLGISTIIGMEVDSKKNVNIFFA